jgi:hypothetical protein
LLISFFFFFFGLNFANFSILKNEKIMLVIKGCVFFYTLVLFLSSHLSAHVSFIYIGCRQGKIFVYIIMDIYNFIQRQKSFQILLASSTACSFFFVFFPLSLLVDFRKFVTSKFFKGIYYIKLPIIFYI